MPALTIIWRRQHHAGLGDGCWYAFGSEMGDACGGYWRERGQWRAEVWPPGRQVLGAYYASPRKARTHIERWLQAHPTVACAALDPRGVKGRIERRPDALMAQHLRLYGAGSVPDDDGDDLRYP